MEKLNLTDEFQIDGYWTLPDLDNEVFGTLMYKTNKIEVVIPNYQLDNDFRIPKIVGRNRKEYITLFNSSVVYTDDKHLYKTKLIADYMIIDSKPYDELEKLQLNQIRFSTDKLSLLFGKTVWKSLEEGCGVELTKIPEIRYDIESLDAQLSLFYSYNNKSFITAEEGLVNEFGTKPILTVSYNENKSIISIKEDVRKIAQLLTIVTGAPQIINMFQYKSSTEDQIGNRIPFKGKVYFAQSKPTKKNLQKVKAAYTLDSVSNKFGEVISKYIERYDDLSPTITHLNFILMYRNILESSYVDSVTSIESLSDALFDTNRKIDSNDNQKIREIKSKVKEKFGKDERLRELLFSSIKNIEKLTLKEELKSIFEKLPTKLKKMFVYKEYDFNNEECIDEFVKLSGNARNHLAHGNSTKVFSYEEMRSVLYILSMVAEYNLMKYIGLEESDVINGIKMKRIYQPYLIPNYKFESLSPIRN